MQKEETAAKVRIIRLAAVISMSRYKDLLPHAGHKITCGCYGTKQDNVRIKCEDCNEVIVSAPSCTKDEAKKMNNSEILTVTQEKWDSICTDYKGIFHDYYNEQPEWKGRRCVMSGCVCDDLGQLLIEGVHFVIV